MATITCTCFWCDKPTGKTRGSAHGEDRRAVVSYDPCKECGDDFARGIPFFEVSNSPRFDNQPAVPGTNSLFPTGQYSIVEEDEVRKHFPTQADEIVRDRRALITPEVYKIKFGGDK